MVFTLLLRPVLLTGGKLLIRRQRTGTNMEKL